MRRTPKEGWRPTLDDERVLLSVAATVAYFVLADAKAEFEQGRDFATAVARAAVAVSRVAPLYVRGDGAPASPSQLEELLHGPLRAGEAPDLDCLLVRRGDLRAAIRALQKAGAPLG